MQGMKHCTLCKQYLMSVLVTVDLCFSPTQSSCILSETLVGKKAQQTSLRQSH